MSSSCAMSCCCRVVFALVSTLLVGCESPAAGAGPAVDATARPAAPGDAAALQLGRTYHQWLLDGEAELLRARFSPEMLAAIPDVAAMVADFNARIGPEGELLGEDLVPFLKYRVYARRARYPRVDRELQVTWTLQPGALVAGLHYAPPSLPADSAYEGRPTRADLRLPFDGEWYVFWGGRDHARNYHVVARDQRYAYDLVAVVDERTHVGDGTRNEDYHCWERPILAPAAGTVVHAVDGVHDNVPGRMNPGQPFGNTVTLDFGGGEFGVFCHFRMGSVAVAVGDSVQRGQRLGLCGSSGNSSEPHLHFHLQDGAAPFVSAGLPAQFLGYRADGVCVSRGEPTRGQTIEHVDG